MADSPPSKMSTGKVILTPREQDILVAALRSLNENSEIEVNYAALAQEIGVKDARSATSSWHVVKKKVFAGLSPATPRASSSASTSSSKVTKAPSPRKPRQTRTPKSATKAQGKTVAKGPVETEATANLDEDDADSVNADLEATDVANGHVTRSDDGSDGASTDFPITDAATTPMTGVESAIANKTEPEPTTADKGKAKEMITVADDMSAGSMSPPPTPTIRKSPAAKKPATPKSPKTPGDSNSTLSAATETPLPPCIMPKKRKPKAEKDAEAAVAAGRDGEASSEKPAKKLRKTPVKKAETAEGAAGEGAAGEGAAGEGAAGEGAAGEGAAGEGAAGEGVAEGAADGGSGEKPAPAKKHRKPSVKKVKADTAAGATTPGSSTHPSAEADTEATPVNEKKKPGRKPVAKKADTAAVTAAEDEGENLAPREKTIAELEAEAAAATEKLENARLAKMAKDANDVLGGKKIEVNVAKDKKTQTAVETLNKKSEIFVEIPKKKIDSTSNTIAPHKLLAEVTQSAKANPPHWGVALNNASGTSNEHSTPQFASEQQHANLTGHDTDTIIVAPMPAAVGGEKKTDTIVAPTKGKDGADDDDDIDDDDGEDHEGNGNADIDETGDDDVEQAMDEVMAAMTAAGATS